MSTLNRDSFASLAEWQAALNTAHTVILLSAELESLGLLTEEQHRRAWEIQTAASRLGLAPKHTPSAVEIAYKDLLIRHDIINDAGAVIRLDGLVKADPRQVPPGATLFGIPLPMMSWHASLTFAALWGLSGLLSSVLAVRSGSMILVVLATAALIPTAACLRLAWLSRALSDFR